MHEWLSVAARPGQPAAVQSRSDSSRSVRQDLCLREGVVVHSIHDQAGLLHPPWISPCGCRNRAS